MVRQVEGLRPELEVDPFRKGKSLVDGRVERHILRSTDRAILRAAEEAVSRNRKCVRVEDVSPVAASLDFANLVWSARQARIGV